MMHCNCDVTGNSNCQLHWEDHPLNRIKHQELEITALKLQVQEFQDACEALMNRYTVTIESIEMNKEQSESEILYWDDMLPILYYATNPAPDPSLIGAVTKERTMNENQKKQFHEVNLQIATRNNISSYRALFLLGLIHQQEQKFIKAIEALKFYANDANYDEEFIEPGTHGDSLVTTDGGNKAREAVEAIGAENASD